MKSRTRIWFRVFLIMLCSVLLCGMAAAAACNLRVGIRLNGEPLADISVEVIRAATVTDGVYSWTEDFADLSLSADQAAKELLSEQAEQIYQYVLARELSGEIRLTDENGNADFENLEEGLYLVFERGGQAVAFRPYLVILPGEIGDSVYSAPKIVPGDTKSILVLKEWNDNDNAAGMRPGSLEVTLYHNGVAIRSVVLNEACDWQHTFTLLPVDGEYSVEENEIPGYSCVYETVEEGFALINTYANDLPDDPDDPKPPFPKPPADPEDPQEPEAPEEPAEPELPQTGFQMWPIYLMLGVGVVLVVMGLAEVWMSREVTWEEEQEES